MNRSPDDCIPNIEALTGFISAALAVLGWIVRTGDRLRS